MRILTEQRHEALRMNVARSETLIFPINILKFYFLNQPLLKHIHSQTS